MKLIRLSPYVFVSAVTLSLLSGCLKSRVQLNKEEEGPDTAPVKTQVTEVHTAQRSAELDEMRAEMNRLNQKVEELEKTNKDLNSDLSKQSKAKSNESTQLEDRIHELEQAQATMIEAMKKKEQEKPARAAADSGSTLKKAEKLYEAEAYSDVVDLVGDYLKNPKNPKQEEATSLRAESYFALKQYKKAILDYNTLTEKFPKSKRSPHYLLQIAKSFEKLGMKSDAKVFYQELHDKFPQSPEAKKAK